MDEIVDRRKKDRRSNEIGTGQIQDVLDVLTSASSSATSLGEKVDNLAKARRRDRLLSIVILIGVVAVGISAWSQYKSDQRLEGIAADNRRNGRILVECTTASPAPGTAIDKEDEVHECKEQGASDGQTLAQGIVDQNKNRIPDFDETIAFLGCLQRGVTLVECPLPEPTLPEIPKRR